MRWDRVEKAGWFVLGVGMVRLDWISFNDHVFGAQWGLAIVGVIAIAGAIWYQKQEAK